MQVELGGGSEPMLRATEVELFDGLVARGLPGRGALAAPDDATYDRVYAHCDVLVVGGGPAGLAAAYAASATGARVILAESAPELWPRAPGDRGPVRHAGERLAIAPETRVLLRTTAVGALRRGLRRARRAPHRPPARRRRRPACRASGCGTCGRGRSCSPPARTSGRSPSRATTSPA